jgi:hypothetical protein
MQGAAQRPFVTQNHPILNHADLPFKLRTESSTAIVVVTSNGKSRKSTFNYLDKAQRIV